MPFSDVSVKTSICFFMISIKYREALINDKTHEHLGGWETEMVISLPVQMVIIL